MSRIETIGMKKHGSHAPSHSTYNYVLSFFYNLIAMFSMVHENIDKKENDSSLLATTNKIYRSSQLQIIYI